MQVVYFDAGSGVSGDMTVGALLDAGGLDIGGLRAALSLLPVGGYRIGLDRVEVGGIRAASFRVVVEEPPELHRDWTTIRGLIEDAGRRGLADGTVARSCKVFQALANAEGTVHGVPADRVHFHEVGAIDSIVDIVGVAWCLEQLEVEACFVGPLPSGSGYVDTQHGRLPVPAPATVELLRGFEIAAGDGRGELVTPTGAAILRALAKPLRPTFRLTAVGHGAGSRRLEDRPNVLRVLLGQCEGHDEQNVVLIEADIDDMTPAALAHVAERLRAAGARDVVVMPTTMKKSRTGMRLSVICDVADLADLAERILAESTTIGLRYRACGRVVLARRIEVVETRYGTIALKVVVRPGGAETAEPELDDLARAALTHRAPLADVRAAAVAAWRQSGGPNGGAR